MMSVPGCQENRGPSCWPFVCSWQHLFKICFSKGIQSWLVFSLCLPLTSPSKTSTLQILLLLTFYMHLLPRSTNSSSFSHIYTHTHTECIAERQRALCIERQKLLFLQIASWASGWGLLCQRGEEGQTTGQEYNMWGREGWWIFAISWLILCSNDTYVMFC